MNNIDYLIESIVNRVVNEELDNMVNESRAKALQEILGLGKKMWRTIESSKIFGKEREAFLKAQNTIVTKLGAALNRDKVAMEEVKTAIGQLGELSKSDPKAAEEVTQNLKNAIGDEKKFNELVKGSAFDTMKAAENTAALVEQYLNIIKSAAANGKNMKKARTAIEELKKLSPKSIRRWRNWSNVLDSVERINAAIKSGDLKEIEKVKTDIEYLKGKNVPDTAASWEKKLATAEKKAKGVNAKPLTQDVGATADVTKGVAPKVEKVEGNAIITNPDGSRVMIDANGNGVYTAANGQSSAFQNGRIISGPADEKVMAEIEKAKELAGTATSAGKGAEATMKNTQSLIDGYITQIRSAAANVENISGGRSAIEALKELNPQKAEAWSKVLDSVERIDAAIKSGDLKEIEKAKSDIEYLKGKNVPNTAASWEEKLAIAEKKAKGVNAKPLTQDASAVADTKGVVPKVEKVEGNAIITNPDGSRVMIDANGNGVYTAANGQSSAFHNGRIISGPADEKVMAEIEKAKELAGKNTIQGGENLVGTGAGGGEAIVKQSQILLPAVIKQDAKSSQAIIILDDAFKDSKEINFDFTATPKSGLDAILKYIRDVYRTLVGDIKNFIFEGIHYKFDKGHILKINGKNLEEVTRGLYKKILDAIEKWRRTGKSVCKTLIPYVKQAEENAKRAGKIQLGKLVLPAAAITGALLLVNKCTENDNGTGAETGIGTGTGTGAGAMAGAGAGTDTGTGAGTGAGAGTGTGTGAGAGTGTGTGAGAGAGTGAGDDQSQQTKPLGPTGPATTAKEYDVDPRIQQENEAYQKLMVYKNTYQQMTAEQMLAALKEIQNYLNTYGVFNPKINQEHYTEIQNLKNIIGRYYTKIVGVNNDLSKAAPNNTTQQNTQQIAGEDAVKQYNALLAQFNQIQKDNRAGEITDDLLAREKKFVDECNAFIEKFKNNLDSKTRELVSQVTKWRNMYANPETYYSNANGTLSTTNKWGRGLAQGARKAANYLTDKGFTGLGNVAQAGANGLGKRYNNRIKGQSAARQKHRQDNYNNQLLEETQAEINEMRLLMEKINRIDNGKCLYD